MVLATQNDIKTATPNASQGSSSLYKSFLTSFQFLCLRASWSRPLFPTQGYLVGAEGSGLTALVATVEGYDINALACARPAPPRHRTKHYVENGQAVKDLCRQGIEVKVVK